MAFAARHAMMLEQVEHWHKNGTLRAKGHMLDGALSGYWEWFRIDGTKLRSGHFDNGQQVGEWITYDRSGRPHKVTKKRGSEQGDQ
ncbi:toxin-antitoxin system YwqK family antitoxin [Brucella tritici]|nr:hypothetical protein [Brucella tritici]